MNFYFKYFLEKFKNRIKQKNKIFTKNIIRKFIFNYLFFWFWCLGGEMLANVLLLCNIYEYIHTIFIENGLTRSEKKMRLRALKKKISNVDI